MEFLSLFVNLISKYPVISFIIVGYISGYVITTYIYWSSFFNKISIFTDNLTELSFSIMCMILLSSVEVMIGSIRFLLWMIWNATCAATLRQFVYPIVYGPSFIIIPMFITFISHHKPYFYFKIKNFNFSDKFLYSILFVQFILIKLGSNLIDLLIILCSQLIWKLGILIIHKFDLRNRIENNEIENY